VSPHRTEFAIAAAPSRLYISVMGPRVRMGVLGDLDVSRDGTPVPLGGPCRGCCWRPCWSRAVARFRSTNCEALWDGAPPASALASLQAYVSRLRKALGPGVLASTATGYRLEEVAVAVDAEEFRDAVVQAGGLGGRPAAMVRVLAPALRLWRGPAVLNDLGSRAWSYGYASELGELRQRAHLRLANAHLALGQPDEAAALAAAVWGEQPYHEEAARLLMLARYSGNRQEEALARVRTVPARAWRRVGAGALPRARRAAGGDPRPRSGAAAGGPAGGCRTTAAAAQPRLHRPGRGARQADLALPIRHGGDAGRPGRGGQVRHGPGARASQPRYRRLDPGGDSGSAVLALVELADRLGVGGV
jgi:DNA-binding SARP family transcriptional activator